jgi:DNA-binding NarL/FixJ family response regulator
MSQIRVLVVEDEPLIADDIKEFLTNADYFVTAVAYDKEDALEALSATKPDIALLDINLGNNMDGFLIAEEINNKYRIPFLYLTSYSSKHIVEQAKHTRPMGYIVKPFDEADLFSSIEVALFNHSQLNKPKHFSRELINERLMTDLTAKEFDVLTDIYEGRTNKQMAEKHFVSINTIKTHVQKVYDKMDTHTRSETIAAIRTYLS